MSERKSALLTRSHRDYVMGRTDPSNVSEYRSRVVDRVFTGLEQDGKFLKQMEPDLRREIFREWEKRNYTSQANGIQVRDPGAMNVCFEQHRFQSGLRGLLYFLYLGIEESALDGFDKVLEDAIDSVARERGQYVKHFELTIEYGDVASLDDIHRWFENGELEFEDLTIPEIEALVKSGRLELDDLSRQELEFLDDACRGFSTLQDWFDTDRAEETE
jgi:hypothetical protein